MQRKTLVGLRLALLSCVAWSGAALAQNGGNNLLLPGAVVHAASFRPNTVAPGQILTIFLEGIGLGSGATTSLDEDGRLPSEFNGVRASLNGLPAPIFYVGANQATVLAPSGIEGARSARLELTDFQQRQHKVTVPLRPTAPALFLHGNDTSLAVATDAFGRVITRQDPARAGDVVVFYASGDGVRSPDLPDGAPAGAPFPMPQADVRITVADSPVELLYVGAAPGFVGLLQINGRLPDGLPTGDLPLRLMAGAQASPAGAHLPVEGERDYQPNGILIRPGENIQAVVNAAPGGSTFRIGAGVHRMQQIAPRSFDRFIGETGAVLNGSRLLTNFQRSGSLWFADSQTQQGKLDGDCRPHPDDSAYLGCQFPEDLYFDNVPLRQVESLGEVAPGSWFFDYGADRVYFAHDPAGHTVEVGVSAYAFRSGGRDIQIRGLTIEKYANPSQTGAIHAADFQNRLASGWIVEDCEVRLNHGTGILVGDAMKVRKNRVLRNGQLGIGGGGVGSLIEDNEIAFNNYADFDPFWEAGGTKFFLTRNLIVRGNFVHRNDGTGLWTDIDNVGVLFEKNVVTDNGLRGIQHEISFDAVIRDNVVERNGLDFDDWLWGAQILVQNSSGVDVYDNEVVVSAAGGDGIALIQQDRGGSEVGPYITVNNRVYNNQITYLGAVGQSGAVADFDQDGMLAGGNTFNFNVHRVANPNRRHWAWGGFLNWNGFKASGQEGDGALVSLTGN